MNNFKASLLFAAVVIIWGVNWTVTKILVMEVSPIWTTAVRSIISAGVLFVLQLAARQFVIPRRGDVPVILAVSVCHMILFAGLMAVGLQYISVGRSVVLGYTMPLWVAPGAWLLLREPMPPARVAGLALGLGGLLVLFNPLTLDWSDTQALTGNAFLLLAAMCWAGSILYVRVHTWISTPFQLVFWQLLLSAVVLSALAFILEGPLTFTLTPSLAGLMLYSALFGSAFGFWAVVVINAYLPASVTALGLLATPVVGIASSLLFLGEAVDLPLILSGGMILGGIALGTVRQNRS